MNVLTFRRETGAARGAVFPLSAAQAFRLKKRTVASAIRWKAA